MSRLFTLREVLSPDLSVRIVEGDDGVDSGFLEVRNEHGRQLFVCEATPLSLDDWRRFFAHLRHVVEAEGWIQGLDALASKERPS